MADNKDIVRRVIERGYNKGELEVLDECCADDYVIHEAFGRDLDTQGEKNLIQTYRNAFPDLNVKIEELIEEGDMVCARWSATGTHQGELLGIPATGNTATNRGLFMARCQDGKAVEAWQVFDTLGFIRQLRGEAGAEAPMKRREAEVSPQ